jgi:hypothetical protein
VSLLLLLVWEIFGIGTHRGHEIKGILVRILLFVFLANPIKKECERNNTRYYIFILQLFKNVDVILKINY